MRTSSAKGQPAREPPPEKRRIMGRTPGSSEEGQMSSEELGEPFESAPVSSEEEGYADAEAGTEADAEEARAKGATEEEEEAAPQALSLLVTMLERGVEAFGFATQVRFRAAVANALG